MLVRNIAAEKIAHTKRKKRVGDDTFSASSDSNEVNDTRELGEVRVNISSLWTLQAFDNRNAEIEIMQRAGTALLEALGDIRMSMLIGGLNESRLTNLSAAIKDAEVELHFPDLQEALEDIKLRAAVELAKLERVFCN